MTEQRIYALAAWEESHTFWYIGADGEPQELISSHRDMEGTRRPIYRQLSGLFSMVRTATVLAGSLTGQTVGIIPVRELEECIDVWDKAWAPIAELLLSRRFGSIPVKPE